MSVWNRRRTLWLLLVIVVICVVAFLLHRQRGQAGKPQEPTAKAGATEAGEVRNWAGTYFYAGMPKPLPSFQHQITVLTNIGYVVGYCEASKDPTWVCYRLVRVSNFQAPPRPKGFQCDTRTRAQVSQQDYTGSGYDRGHMAPNYAIALCYGAQAQMETFLMSNIIPQRPNLNRKVWEHLEQTEIKDYAQRYRQLWVIDGPVFKQGAKRMRCGVEIPDACYKILVEQENGQPRMLAFIMPQNVKGTESPSQFLTSVSEIEKETGLDFLSDLPKDMESRLEAETARGMW